MFNKWLENKIKKIVNENNIENKKYEVIGKYYGKHWGFYSLSTFFSWNPIYFNDITDICENKTKIKGVWVDNEDIILFKDIYKPLEAKIEARHAKKENK